MRIQQWMKQRLVEPGYCHTTAENEKINQGAENIHIYHCILPSNAWQNVKSAKEEQLHNQQVSYRVPTVY